MISLIKMSVRVLLRNKGFLFFLLITPVLSAYILNMKTEHTVYDNGADAPEIHELKDCTERAVYMGDTSACIIKVYDAAGSQLSEYMLEKMAATGMFSICRCDVHDMTESQVFAQAKNDAFDDRAGMLLYIKSDFQQAVFDGAWEKGLQLYVVSEDERQKLFMEEVENVLKQIKQAQMMVGDDCGAVLELLRSVAAEIPEKKVVTLTGKEDVELTVEQVNQRAQIGYAFAIITLGFLFCGVFVAHTVIEEQNNKVFTRVMLSKLRIKDYFIAKSVVSFLICIMQTLVLAVCLSVIQGIDFGINIVSFLFVIFLQGLIFSTLSFVLGVLLNDVMSSNYAVFAIWSISALLAGLYFPLDDTTPALKTISYLMPQRWFMDAAELLLVGDNGAYSMLLYITGAYLIVIISIGSVGLKMKGNAR